MPAPVSTTIFFILLFMFLFYLYIMFFHNVITQNIINLFFSNVEFFFMLIHYSFFSSNCWSCLKRERVALFCSFNSCVNQRKKSGKRNITFVKYSFSNTEQMIRKIIAKHCCQMQTLPLLICKIVMNRRKFFCKNI